MNTVTYYAPVLHCQRTGAIIKRWAEFQHDPNGKRTLAHEHITMEHPESPVCSDKAPEVRLPRRFA